MVQQIANIYLCAINSEIHNNLFPFSTTVSKYAILTWIYLTCLLNLDLFASSDTVFVVCWNTGLIVSLGCLDTGLLVKVTIKGKCVVLT
jgi:hypothetical protein